MERRLELAGVIILICAALIANTLFGSARSSDLLATWIAGQMFITEQFSQIYVTSEPVFTMTPPESWPAFMRNYSNYDDAIFPYLYPPLWAWAASLLGDISFEAIGRVATLINATLMSGCVYLGYRITRAPVNLLVFSTLTLPILYLTPIGAIAMFENQPQILVSFLLLLTLERLRAKDEITAGIVLAIAAAIKVYPVVFVVLFLASNNKRAFFTFFITGGCLGLLSILVAGWPLHLEFLASAKTASATTIISNLNYNIHGPIAQIFASDRLMEIATTVDAAVTGEIPTWFIYQKGPVWQAISTLVSVALIGATALMLHTSTQARRFELIWPFAFIVVPLLSPFGWSYYYIAAIVLAPAIFHRLPPVFCWIILCIIFVLTFLPTQIVYSGLFYTASAYQIVSTAAMICLAGLFLFLIWTKADR